MLAKDEEIYALKERLRGGEDNAVHAAALQRDLAAKVAENAQLLQICDQLMTREEAKAGGRDL